MSTTPRPTTRGSRSLRRIATGSLAATALATGLLTAVAPQPASADPVQCVDVYDTHGKLLAHICVPII